jgi:hypothetical protein
MSWRWISITLVVVLSVAVGVAEVAAGGLRKDQVPNLRDAEIQAQFVALSVSRLDGDPDFPALFLGNVTEVPPQYLVVIVDARNGEETWSLQEDAAIFLLILADRGTIEQAFLDEGFATTGTPSGSFIAAGPETAGDLLNALREIHGRLRSLRDA